MGFVDLPADYIQGTPKEFVRITPVDEQPKISGSIARITALANALRGAKRPLIVVGKGAAYARAEDVLHHFVNS